MKISRDSAFRNIKYIQLMFPGDIDPIRCLRITYRSPAQIAAQRRPLKYICTRQTDNLVFTMAPNSIPRKTQITSIKTNYQQQYWTTMTTIHSLELKLQLLHLMSSDDQMKVAHCYPFRRWHQNMPSFRHVIQEF